MSAKDEPHKHAYKKLVMTPCIAIINSDRRAMGILSRVCECGAKQAFEYGERNAMKELGKQYAEKQSRSIQAAKDSLAGKGQNRSTETVATQGVHNQ